MDVDNYPNLIKDINLAYNNPKSFFNKSLENWDNFSNNKKSKRFWWIYWIIAIGMVSVPSSNVSEDQKGFFGVLILFLFSIYPLWQRIKNLRQGKSKVDDFKKTEEYQKVLKDF